MRGHVHGVHVGVLRQARGGCQGGARQAQVLYAAASHRVRAHRPSYSERDGRVRETQLRGGAHGEPGGSARCRSHGALSQSCVRT